MEAKKIRKRSPKPLQNGGQEDGPKSNPEGWSRGKWEKCKNEQHFKVLARFFDDPGGPKSEEKSINNTSQMLRNWSALSKVIF